MTYKLILGKGRLHFRHWGYQMDATTLKETMEAPYKATVQMAGDIYERFVNTVLFTMRVHWIVGYNPQKLLPAPSPFNRPVRRPPRGIGDRGTCRSGAADV